MRRELAIAALGVFLAAPLWGQMRGGARMSAPAGRVGFATSSVRATNWGFRGGFGFGPNRVFINTNPFFFPRNRFGFRPRPVYWPGYYGGYYGGYSYPMVQSQPVVVQTAPPNYYSSYSSDYYRSDPDRRDRDLVQAVDRLSGEVAELRQEQQARQQPQREQPATVLVLKDNHIQEVKNYAVIGQTVWVFSEQTSKKIPLANLDLERTARLNEERGVDFQLPK